MTTSRHDDAGPTTAVEEALSALDTTGAGPRPHAHLRAVDSRVPRPAGAPRTDASAATGRARVATALPAESAATERSPGPRLRLVPALRPVPARTVTPAAPPPVLVERVRGLAMVDRVRTADHDDDRGAAPTADPGRFAHGVGLACVEVTLGRRPAAQLARWVGPGVLEMLQQRADLVRRSGIRTHARRPAARRVRVCAVDAHTTEACLVVDDGARVRAVALRLEAHRGAWRVTQLEIG